MDPETRFEVAAIKPLDEAVGGQVLMRMTPGRFESSLACTAIARIS